MKQIKLINFCLIVLYFLSVIQQVKAQDLPGGAASGTTGGQGGPTVTVSSLSELQNYANASSPYIILVNGTISSSSFVEVDVSSNKTIVGLGTGATLSNIELHIETQQNIIIRNLTIRDSYVASDPNGDINDNDGIQADNTDNIWIDHCHLTHCGDGLLDLREGCDNVTVSYVHFSDHYKTFGIGWTDETEWEMTIHHCWFDGTITRNPSFDQGKGHLYNNYMSGNTAYGNLARGNARVIIQNSRYDNVHDPLALSGNGVIYSSGNSFNSCTGNQSGNTSSMPWTPNYSYSLDDASGLRVQLMNETGPQSFVSDQYTSGSSGFNPYTTIQADSFSSQSGVQTEACSEGGLNVSHIQNGDWAHYRNVDFGSNGAISFTGRVASNTSGGNIEIRLGSPTGSLVGTCAVSNTGGWQTWANATTSISGATGVHDLYLVFTGGSGYLLNLNHFSFTEGSGSNPTPTYDFVVAKDGSGDFTTVQAAIDAAPSNSSSRTEIFIKNGTYYEVITVHSSRTNLTLIGESATGTVLTYNNYASKINPATGSGYGTSGSASVFINGAGFYGLNLTFENSSGPVGQAVAVRSTADKAIFKNCRFLGNQDTYYAHSGRAYHDNCYIDGTTDFIFGGAIGYFENCHLYTKGGAAITAASTPQHVAYGYVFNNCQITGSGSNITDLGRPWYPYAAVAFLNTKMSNSVSAVGWNDWGDASKQSTSRYAEYNNSGAGYVPNSRPSWVDILSSSQAQPFNMLNVLKANSANPQVTDNWNPLDVINSTVGGSSDPFGQIEAESFSGQSGVQTEACSEGGLNASHIENGDWIRFDDIDFGSGADGFSARVASNTSGGTITLRIGSPTGTQIGSASVSGTGGWQSWATVSGTANVSGVHDLYLLFSGGSGYLFNINHFSFTPVAGGSNLAEGTYSIISQNSGKAMEVFDFSTANGGNIVQWDYWGGDFQHWRVISVGDGFYRIENVGSGRVLDVTGGSTDNGANIQQYGYGSGGTNKEFKFEDTGGGYYRIIARHSDKCVDVSDYSTADGANIHQYEYLGTTNQHWQLNYLSGLRKTQKPAEKLDEVNVLKVYPNPASNEMFVDLSRHEGVVRIDITDMGGRLLKSQVLENNRLDITDLKTGIYLVNLVSQAKKETGRLIVK